MEQPSTSKVAANVALKSSVLCVTYFIGLCAFGPIVAGVVTIVSAVSPICDHVVKNLEEELPKIVQT